MPKKCCALNCRTGYDGEPSPGSLKIFDFHTLEQSKSCGRTGKENLTKRLLAQKIFKNLLSSFQKRRYSDLKEGEGRERCAERSAATFSAPLLLY